MYGHAGRGDGPAGPSHSTSQGAPWAPLNDFGNALGVRPRLKLRRRRRRLLAWAIVFTQPLHNHPPRAQGFFTGVGTNIARTTTEAFSPLSSPARAQQPPAAGSPQRAATAHGPGYTHGRPGAPPGGVAVDMGEAQRYQMARARTPSSSHSL